MKKRILQLSAVAALVAVSVSGVANTVNVGVTIGDTLTTSNPTTASFGTVTVGTGTLIIRLPRSGPLTRVSAPSTGTVTTGQAGAITITGTGTGNVTITWPSGSIATGVAVDLAELVVLGGGDGVILLVRTGEFMDLLLCALETLSGKWLIFI